MWILFSLLAGVMFGIRGSMYHLVSKLNINRNLLLTGVFTCGAIVYAALTFMTQTPMTLSTLVGVQMGLLSTIANGAMYKGFAVGKASIIAMLTALPPIVVVIFAYIFWNERLSLIQIMALLAIIIGLIFIKYTSDITLKNMQGAQWGIITLFFFAFNDLSGKWSTILEAPRYPTLMFMFLTGATSFYIAFLLGKSQIRKNQLVTNKQVVVHALQANSPKPIKQFCMGLLIGFSMAAGMYFMLEAFETGKAGLVSALASINAVIVLLYTRFVAKEKLRKSELLGILMIIIAVMIIQAFSNS